MLTLEEEEDGTREDTVIVATDAQSKPSLGRRSPRGQRGASVPGESSAQWGRTSQEEMGVGGSGVPGDGKGTSDVRDVNVGTTL